MIDLKTAGLFHLYGINNGLFIASSIFTFLFAISFLLKKNRRIKSLFMLASLGYLFLGLFNLYFQQFHLTEIAQIYPDILLWLGKVSIPITLSLFTYLFVYETVIRSKQAYDFVETNKGFIYGLYAMDIIATIFLLLVSDIKLALIINQLLYIPHVLLGAIYTYIVLGKSTIGKLLSALFCFSAIEYIVIIILIFQDFSGLSSSVIFSGHLFLSFVTIFFSFVIISFSYEQVKEVENISRIEHQRLMSDINKAISTDEFFMVYQPKLDLFSNKVCGAEALIRWIHPQLGFIPPDKFISVAEKSHMIDGICKWVIKATTQQAKVLQENGIKLPISINFSVKNLTVENIRYLQRALEYHQLPIDAIMIEITETVFLQYNVAEAEALELIHELNIPLSLDDYGTGFSSLSSINQLALTEIKIDRQFVSDIEENHEHLIIVKSTLQMSKQLGINVVAEGVEEDATIDLLKELFCDTVQGYGIAKPMKPDDFLTWLHESEYHFQMV